MDSEAKARVAATAATLRQVAGWGLSFSDKDQDDSADELHQTADAVEAMGDDDPCCPVCQEILCDEDCPLVGIRIYERHPTRG